MYPFEWQGLKVEFQNHPRISPRLSFILHLYKEWKVPSRLYDIRSTSRIYVGNIPNATKEDLTACFEKFGRIVNIWIARNPPGFGFVTFETPEAAQNAVNDGKGQIIQGVSIDVQMARQRVWNRGNCDL